MTRTTPAIGGTTLATISAPVHVAVHAPCRPPTLRIVKTALVLGCLVLAGCDGDGDDGVIDDGRTLRGTIALDTRARVLAPAPAVDPADVRVALVWYGELTDSSRRPWVTQDVVVLQKSSSWPIEFRLAITEPPPAGAIHYELGYSQAKFVAYVDKNGNGALDWTPPDADAFLDEIVAYHPHLYLWFFDDGGLKLMLPGSSELVDPATPITLLERSDLRSSCHLLEWTPRFSFEALRHSYPDPDEGDQGPYDHQGFPICTSNEPPPGARVACQGDGVDQYQYYTSWTTTTSAFVSATCGPVMSFCEGRRADPTAPGPWPCPCDPTRYACVQYQLEI